jgi:hypothetical protein
MAVRQAWILTPWWIITDGRLFGRFFERIAKTYRREKWGSMLRPLLSTWYACAQQLGAVELSVKLLIEMLGHGDCYFSFDAIEYKPKDPLYFRSDG